MDQNQTRRERDDRLGLAALCAALIDGSLLDFDALLGLYRLRLPRAATLDDLRDTYNEYLVEFAQLVDKAAGFDLVGAQLLESTAGVPVQHSRAKLSNVAAETRAGLLRRAATRFDEVLAGPAINSNAAGIGPLEPIGEELLAASAVIPERRAFDFLGAHSIQAGIFHAGTGIFRRKQAVVVQDSRTTELCGSRMAGQVQDWSEPFVDPKTGAQWLFPPFIYGGLPAAECFHWCRTGVEPAL